MGQESGPAGQDLCWADVVAPASAHRSVVDYSSDSCMALGASPLRRGSGQVANLYQLTGGGGPIPPRSDRFRQQTGATRHRQLARGAA